MPGGRPLALLFDGVYYHYVRVEPRFPIKYLSKRKNRTQNFHSQIFASARFARSGPRFARLRQQNFDYEKC